MKLKKTLGRICKDHGFSILEVLIALSIFSIGILAVAQMQIVAMNNNKTVAMRSDAMWMGQERMESVAARAFSELSSLVGTTTKIFRHRTYDVTVTLGTLVGTAGNQSRDVAVVVSFEDRGKDREIILRTVRVAAEE